MQTPVHAAQQTHPSPTPSNHSAGIQTTPTIKPPATFQAPLAEMLPIAPAATASHATPLQTRAGSASSQLHSSQVLHDLQTSVSPVLPSQPQPVAHHTTPSPGLPSPEVTSPVALAPCSTAQPEAPTPTLLPRGSVTGPTDVSGSPAVEPAVEFAGESPRNILSSLQQMNLQSRPFDFAGNAEGDMSLSVPEQTPEPVDHPDSDQENPLEPMLEQTPEPFPHSTQEKVGVWRHQQHCISVCFYRWYIRFLHVLQCLNQTSRHSAYQSAECGVAASMVLTAACTSNDSFKQHLKPCCSHDIPECRLQPT